MGIYQVKHVYGDNDGWLTDANLREHDVKFAARMEWKGIKNILKDNKIRLG